MGLTRRTLLSSVAVAALVQPALSQVRQLLDAPRPFWGNPNVTITAINTDGGISCSRTSGQTPCFIQVSASAITATGTTAPYEDLEYHWDFGDPNGTEIFSRPTDGAKLNANSDQHGPDAAYVYRRAGTFTVTLTVRGRNGAGYISNTVTRDITVAPFDARGGEWYFDSNAPAGGTGSIQRPFNSLASLNAKISLSNTAIHIKRGSVFSGGIQAIVTEVRGLRIDAYGEGANPLFQIESGHNHAFVVTNGGSRSSPKAKSDFVISNIDFSNVGTQHAVAFYNAIGDNGSTLHDNYFDHCNATTVRASDGWTFEGSRNIGIWGGSLTGTQTPGTGARKGIYGGARQWFFLVGVSISGAGSYPVFDHHVYANCTRNGLYRWVNLGPGPMRNLGLKLRVGPALGPDGPYHLVSECNLTGAQIGVAPGNGNNSADPAQGRYTNIIFQNNAFHDLPLGAIYLASCLSVTIRDNTMWNTPSRLCTPGLDLYNLCIAKTYRNKIYGNRATADVISYLNGRGVWSTPQTITDNVFYFTSPASRIVSIVFSDFKSNGSIIDRNQYWAPNDTDGKYLFNGPSGVSFGPVGSAGTWQNAGFDRNGRVANPNWPDPANGKFS
jgi:hypothetical protein